MKPAAEAAPVGPGTIDELCAERIRAARAALCACSERMCSSASSLSSWTVASVSRLSRRAVASSRWLQASRSRTARCSAVRAATVRVVAATCFRVLRVAFRVSCICSFASLTSFAIRSSCAPMSFR